MRRVDWEQRLHELVTANLNRPHEFGQWDCLLWPAAAVKAVTGKDAGRGHRKKYDSHAKAYRYLGKLGFDSPAAMLDSLFSEKRVSFAQRGDLVLVGTDAGAYPGVVVGDVALVLGEDGMLQAPRASWLKAWAVG